MKHILGSSPKCYECKYCAEEEEKGIGKNEDIHVCN